MRSTSAIRNKNRPTVCKNSKSFYSLYKRTGLPRGGQGELAPVPQAQRGLITLNVSRSGRPQNVYQHYCSKVNF